MSYSVTIREHEMGEQPFIENRHDTLGEALANATALLDRHAFGDLENETLESWIIVDPTGDSSLEFCVSFTIDRYDEFNPEGYSTDYLIEVRNDD